jgi:aldose 1-epimerase
MGTFSRRAAFSAGTAVAASAVLADGSTVAAETVAGQEEIGENGRIYLLRKGNQRAIVTGVAASLMSWTVDGEEILFTNDPHVMGESGYQGKTILPWCNRIEAGKYKFGGVEYQVPVNEVSRNTALHGLLNFVEWSPRHCSHDAVELEYVAPPAYGYPFHLRYRIRYSLTDDGVTCRLSATNIGELTAPLTTATHVYIAATKGEHIDDLELTLPANTYYLVDENLIPTGKASVSGTEYDFRKPRKIGATKMDTAFTGVDKHGGRSVATVRRPGSVDVQMWMDSAHNYYQLYTDDGPSVPREHRLGLAFEPMVGAPNAFNSGDGLVTVPAGGTWTGSWGLTAL